MTVAVFYYSQTGQTLQIAQSFCQPLLDLGHRVVYKEIVPERPFPYPWSGDSFFQAFPESRMKISCKIKPIDLSDVADVGLVVVAFQAWFLSLSLPVSAFFQSEEVQRYLNQKNVVTIDGCRNMWVMAHQQARACIARSGGRLVGNIVLQDNHHNLVSVITIVRWLLYGKKEGGKIFPAAGISDKDIAGAAAFGKIAGNALQSGQLQSLQQNLMAAGAIDYKPSIVFVEKTGHKIFRLWSNFVLKKGGYGAPQRSFRLRLFKYYLFLMLYVVSPIGMVVFYLSYPLRLRQIRKDRQHQCLAIM